MACQARYSTSSAHPIADCNVPFVHGTSAVWAVHVSIVFNRGRCRSSAAEVLGLLKVSPNSPHTLDSLVVCSHVSSGLAWMAGCSVPSETGMARSLVVRCRIAIWLCLTVAYIRWCIITHLADAHNQEGIWKEFNCQSWFPCF